MTTTINVNLPGPAPEPATAASAPPAPDDGRAVARRLGRPVRALATTDDHKHGIRAELPTVGGDTTTAVIRLYDVIDDWGGFWGVSALEFAEVLDELPDTITTIQLLVNSPGGFVHEGIAIMNMLRNHPARVTVTVEGIAASAASFIACGQEELVMSANSELMVHDPRGVCYGVSDDMRKYADRLDAVADNIASVYQAKAGGDLADWRAVMAAETWFSAEEAREIGLADAVIDPPTTAADDSTTNRFDLSIFNFAGRENAPEPQYPADHKDDGSIPTSPTQGGSAVAFSDEQLTDLRQKLDVDADADEATILDAVDTLLEQVTAPSDPAPTPDPEAALPDGVVAISEAKLAELTNDAQAGREARDAQVTAEREALVDSAVRDGRIAPAERDAWVNKLEAGTGAEQVLASLKPGVIPVIQNGHGGDADLDSEFSEYNAIYGKEATV